MIWPALLALSSAFAGDGDGPVIVLSDDDRAVEEAGLEAVGQKNPALFASLWEKGFLVGKEDQKVIIGGYVESEYHNDFAGESFFDQHRMVVFLYARPHPRISFATEIEWEHGGTPRKRDGELVVGESLLEFAVADFKITEWLQTRAGIVLVPVGAYNLRHDAPGQDFTTRPLVSTHVAPSTWFEAGAGFFGRIPIGQQRLDYEIYAINGLDTKLYDGLGARAARGSLGEDNNNNKAGVGRLSWRPVTGLEVATSGYRGAYDPGSTRVVSMGAVDLTARYKWLELQGEGVRAWIQPGFDEGWAQATRDPVPEGMSGFYAQVNAHFFPAGLKAILPSDLQDSSFTASVRYGSVDTDRAVVSAGDRNRLMLGLNYRPIEAFVFKNEVLFDTNGTSGSRRVPWFEPELSYVGSVALLF